MLIPRLNVLTDWEDHDSHSLMDQYFLTLRENTILENHKTCLISDFLGRTANSRHGTGLQNCRRMQPLQIASKLRRLGGPSGGSPSGSGLPRLRTDKPAF